MPTIYIDNKPYTIEEEGKNLLEVCLSLGYNLPYFCWHPAMHSVGACRQCAVKQFKDEHDTRGRIVMACMTPAKDGTRISIDDPEAVEFRRSITEWLMLNHPHDCPVCDEGGECHLQDMTVMTGHVYRRNRFPKRTFRNQDLGPFVNHEMNRCIECYRCVRFYHDFAGGRDFNVFGWHDHVYFGRDTDGILESPFSGNLVEVCPTGVFTDKTLKSHYTRKWDLQTAPSICVHCGLGCNTIPGERYGLLRRIRNRFHGAVNGYFLCDRGRYGYEFVNSDRRLRYPLLRDASGTLKQISQEDAIAQVAQRFHEGRVIGIGSPRAALEANFALRSLVGANQFYLPVPENDARLMETIRDVLRQGPARTPSLQEVATADAVLVLGEDVTHTAPLLALSLRQASGQRPLEDARQQMHIAPFDDAALREATQQETGPFFIATAMATPLDAQATAVIRLAPDDQARLGFAVAHAIDPAAPTVADCSKAMLEQATRIARALQDGKRPVVVAGCGAGSEAVIQAAANVAWALCRTGHAGEICFAVPACNSLGLALLGGQPLTTAFAAAHAGEIDTVILLEHDLYHQWDRASVDALLAHIPHVMVIDSLRNKTTDKAELVLPAATFAESDGTFVNSEGRAQRFFQVFVPSGDIQPSWHWLGEMMVAVGDAETPYQYDEIVAALVASDPVFAAIARVAPPASFRLIGQRVPRQPHRYSGRTAMTAEIEIHEPPPPDDPNAPFAFSMEGYPDQPPSPLIPRFWSPGWNSVQAVNKFQQEVGGPLRGGDPGCRLVEPATNATTEYFTAIPHAFTARRDALLILPAQQIFGSEELSALSPGIAELTPAPYVTVHPRDAARLGVRDGEAAVLSLPEMTDPLLVRVRDDVPVGTALMPVGLPGIPLAGLPAWGRISSCVRGASGLEELP